MKRSYLRSAVILNRIGLSNSILPVRKLLPVVLRTRRHNIHGVVIPRHGLSRTSVISKLSMINIERINRLVRLVNNSTACAVPSAPIASRAAASRSPADRPGSYNSVGRILNRRRTG